MANSTDRSSNVSFHNTTPAGWYRDHVDPRVDRWWDGTTWTGATRPVQWGPTHGAPLYPVGPNGRARHDPVMTALLPVGRSGWAIACGYLGLFSILLLPAPFALITGVLALKDFDRHPEKLGRGRVAFGMTVSGLVVIALLFGLLYG